MVIFILFTCHYDICYKQIATPCQFGRRGVLEKEIMRLVGPLLIVVAMLFTVSSHALSAESSDKDAPKKTIRVCNRSNDKLWIALGYVEEKSLQWQSSGWYTLNKASCRSLMSGPRGKIYGYATNDTTGHKLSWTPDLNKTEFCVDSYRKFRLPIVACHGSSNPGIRWHAFGEIKTAESGISMWTLER